MSAERLREAADRLDALAEAATPEPWLTEQDGTTGVSPSGRVSGPSGHITSWIDPDDAALIAALAALRADIATWLRFRAASTTWYGTTDGAGADQDHALAVADAILGGAA